MKEYIKKRVHELYWNEDINCARTTIICLSELFELAIEPQTLWSGSRASRCRRIQGAVRPGGRRPYVYRNLLSYAGKNGGGRRIRLLPFCVCL